MIAAADETLIEIVIVDLNSKEIPLRVSHFKSIHLSARFRTTS